MTKYDIEIGENSNVSRCHCCNKESRNGHGFVYRDDSAYAVYYVGWSSAHTEKKISIALAIGEWDDDSTDRDRTCFGLEAFENDEEIAFGVVGPEESPWPKTELLGEVISRNNGLNHELLDEVLVIAEEVVRHHSAVREFLNVPVDG